MSRPSEAKPNSIVWTNQSKRVVGPAIPFALQRHGSDFNTTFQYHISKNKFSLKFDTYHMVWNNLHPILRQWLQSLSSCATFVLVYTLGVAMHCEENCWAAELQWPLGDARGSFTHLQILMATRASNTWMAQAAHQLKQSRRMWMLQLSSYAIKWVMWLINRAIISFSFMARKRLTLIKMTNYLHRVGT